MDDNDLERLAKLRAHRGRVDPQRAISARSLAVQFRTRAKVLASRSSQARPDRVVRAFADDEAARDAIKAVVRRRPENS
jgi:hypothetical protein